VYLNGVSASDSTSIANPTNGNITTLGAAIQGAGAIAFYNGVIAYPAFWNLALVQADVDYLYGRGFGADPRLVQPAGLISFLRLAQAVSPQPDDNNTEAWKIVGGFPTLEEDPFLLNPVAQRASYEIWRNPPEVVWDDTFLASPIAQGVWNLPAPQILSPSGIASVAAAGNPQLNFTIFPSGIATGAALGNPQLNFTIHPTGIATGVLVGNPQANFIIYPAGIVPSDAFGLAQLNQIIYASGIASGMAFGLPTIAIAGSPQTISPSGIASVASLGLPALLTGPKTVISASCSYADTSAALILCSSGDTLVIPAGNCVWSNTLVVPLPITIRGTGTNLKRAPGFLGPFFCATGWNVPVFTVSGINFSLDQVSQHDHIGRIHFGKRLGGPYIGDVPNVWPGPLYAIVLPDLAHSFPNAGPTSWIDPNQPEND